MKKRKEHSRSWYKKNWADVWFSRYIRQRDKGQCYTCPRKDDPKNMQCGHYIPRQYLAVRYDERNNHCQCYACNMLYNGQPDLYHENLVRDYGALAVSEMSLMRYKITRDLNYKAIGDEYKLKYEKLLNNK